MSRSPDPWYRKNSKATPRRRFHCVVADIGKLCPFNDKPFRRKARGTIWNAINRHYARTGPSPHAAEHRRWGPGSARLRGMPRERKSAEEGAQSRPEGSRNGRVAPPAPPSPGVHGAVSSSGEKAALKGLWSLPGGHIEPGGAGKGCGGAPRCVRRRASRRSWRASSMSMDAHRTGAEGPGCPLPDRRCSAADGWPASLCRGGDEIAAGSWRSRISTMPDRYRLTDGAATFIHRAWGAAAGGRHVNGKRPRHKAGRRSFGPGSCPPSGGRAGGRGAARARQEAAPSRRRR